MDAQNFHIKLDNVCLDYPIYDASAKSFRASLKKLATGGLIGSEKKSVAVQALSNITLEIKSGQRVAIIGHNGAGKTTLLRVIAGIYAPTTGIVEATGEISSLLSMNLGMQPDASGYANIRLAGMMLGMSPTEADALIPDIEAFTGLGDFLKLPIRTYSSGMGMRLAFAIATSIKPDILVVDEIIGVGDRHFYHKANERLANLLMNSHILVISSHDLELVREFCNYGMLLEKGSLVQFGPIDEILDRYKNSPPPG